jgi:hypothetical protein
VAISGCAFTHPETRSANDFVSKDFYFFAFFVASSAFAGVT